MNFALSGPHGSGKTSVFDLLRQDENLHFDYTFVPSCTREVNRLIDILELSREEVQTYICIRQAVIANKSNIIVDRCVLDAFAYTKIANGQIRDNLAASCVKTLKAFNHVFLFEPATHIEPDGERWTNRTIALDVYSCMLDTIQIMEVPHTIIKANTTIADRVDLITRSILKP